MKPSILITGANRGLGLEFARQYAADGWQVYAGCRAPGDAKDLRKIAGSNGGRVHLLALDVSDTTSVRSAADALGGEAIDVLVNNAGVGGPRNERLGRLDYAAWERVLDVNTLGPMRVIEALADNVAKSRERKIVTITSGMGSIADNTSGGSYAYRTSKAAVNMAVKSLSLDLAPRGIVCIVMNPGWVRTDMGGPRGTLAPADSIKAMREVIAGLKPGDTGKFFNYNGKTYPW
ncbi:MAG TPA: SDR family oxidoreductase [Steroidobacteraceae bacterium]|nr:SDR family oxidoreductase [Steroidobacteraceae bacterium]